MKTLEEMAKELEAKVASHVGEDVTTGIKSEYETLLQAPPIDRGISGSTALLTFVRVSKKVGEPDEACKVDIRHFTYATKGKNAGKFTPQYRQGINFQPKDITAVIDALTILREEMTEKGIITA